MININEKLDSLSKTRDYRNKLKQNPQLKNLFLELTTKCNERCIHCGSSCGEINKPELNLGQYKTILNQISQDFNVKDITLCITGGEPLLRKDFFLIF